MKEETVDHTNTLVRVAGLGNSINLLLQYAKEVRIVPYHDEYMVEYTTGLMWACYNRYPTEHEAQHVLAHFLIYKRRISNVRHRPYARG